ncbi:hypothetical protein FACS189475_00190 [Betaproteobacteria bacterium]|nr:hypothetical protein FACS189475_00190 [Betaproteobacteria bacterium]
MYEMAGYKTYEEQQNNSFMATGCMQKAGFVSKSGGVSKSCQIHSRFKSLPACQPDAIFPERSVERRLNSWYCRNLPKIDREYCRKLNFRPAACDRPEEDYNKPPPECLP